jgi:hypothetical protein
VTQNVVFLSRVTAEFGHYDEYFKDNLQLVALKTPSQIDYYDQGFATLDKLWSALKRVEAIVHIVGKLPGAFPRASMVKEFIQSTPGLGQWLNKNSLNPDRWSYTQWEAWLGKFLSYKGKKVRLFLCTLQLKDGEEFCSEIATHLSVLRANNVYPNALVNFASREDLLTKLKHLEGFLDLLLNPQSKTKPPPSPPLPWFWHVSNPEMPAPAPIPISLAMWVGVDRSTQIVLCTGVAPRSVLKEMRKVENSLSKYDPDGHYDNRIWFMRERWDESSQSVGIILDWRKNSPERKDQIESELEPLLKARNLALVIVLPAECAEAWQIASVIRSLKKVQKHAIPVSLLSAKVPTLDTADLTTITAISALDALVPANQPRAQSNFAEIECWLNGGSNSAFCRNATLQQLRLTVLAGRFGKVGGAAISEAQKRRIRALIKSATQSGAVPFVLHALVFHPSVLKMLLLSEMKVRAVLGLIRNEEAKAPLVPWNALPVKAWRHERRIVIAPVPQAKLKNTPQ